MGGSFEAQASILGPEALVSTNSGVDLQALSLVTNQSLINPFLPFLKYILDRWARPWLLHEMAVSNTCTQTDPRHKLGKQAC